MKKSNAITKKSMTSVEKIRAYRIKLYKVYINKHKNLDIHGFYEEMIKGKKCRHA